MIKEIVIVEGKSDVSAVKRSCDAECIATSGWGFGEDIIEIIQKAYDTKGIVIFTDPDHAGENIRKRLTELFPKAKHAFIAQEDAMSGSDIGIENASGETIAEALSKARVSKNIAGDGLCDEKTRRPKRFTHEDLLENDLIGSGSSRIKRNTIGKSLGIGYANAGTFLKRLNAFGVSREEWDSALRAVKIKEHDSEDIHNK